MSIMDKLHELDIWLIERVFEPGSGFQLLSSDVLAFVIAIFSVTSPHLYIVGTTMSIFWERVS